MIQINLERLVLKAEVHNIIRQMINLNNSPICIMDSKGKEIIGEMGEAMPCEYPIALENRAIGMVYGSEKAAVLACLLTCLANLELEKKVLGRETLEKYREITMLYDIAEKLTASLDSKEAAQLVVDVAKMLIKADNISVMLKNEETGVFELLASSGRGLHSGEALRIGIGIAGSVFNSGRAEIVNDISSDERYVRGAIRVSSLMCAPLKTKDRVIGVIYVSSEEREHYTAEDLKLLSALTFQAAADIENARLYDSLKETFLMTVHTLAETIEKRDPYTGGHIKRVMNYSMAVGKELGLPELEMERLELAAVLHDIGKIGIRDDILQKKKKLTAEEFAEIKMHPVHAVEILDHIKHLKGIIPGVKYHHERYDGSGYPEGLKGADIDIIARIISVADAFDAMTSARPYREKMKLTEAFDELRANSGTQFDPGIVKAFFNAYRENRIPVERQAQVERQNHNEKNPDS